MVAVAFMILALGIWLCISGFLKVSKWINLGIGIILTLWAAYCLLIFAIATNQVIYG